MRLFQTKGIVDMGCVAAIRPDVQAQHQHLLVHPRISMGGGGRRWSS
jgi:hypothetical protein